MTRREEVANKLREAGKELDKNIPRNVNGAAQSVLFELFGATCVRDSNSYSEAFSRLANLIDPTCHIVETVEDGRTMYVCSNCYSCKSEDKKQFSKFCYCPCCGARVVRDEA